MYLTTADNRGSVLSVAPNPFNPATTVTFTADRERELTLKVFDMAGRRVVQLFHCVVATGTVRVNWDGRDTRGCTQPSGPYFIRGTVDDWSETRRVRLLK